MDNSSGRDWDLTTRGISSTKIGLSINRNLSLTGKNGGYKYPDPGLINNLQCSNTAIYSLQVNGHPSPSWLEAYCWFVGSYHPGCHYRPLLTTKTHLLADEHDCQMIQMSWEPQFWQFYAILSSTKLHGVVRGTKYQHKHGIQLDVAWAVKQEKCGHNQPNMGT